MKIIGALIIAAVVFSISLWFFAIPIIGWLIGISGICFACRIVADALSE